MISLRIVSRSEKKIEEIAHLILTERLAMDVSIKRNVERLYLKDEKLISSRVFLLTCKTKASLFQTIDKKLQKKYPKHMPEVYSLPIVYMDWKQSNQLKKSVKH